MGTGRRSPLVAVPGYRAPAGTLPGFTKPTVAAPVPYIDALHRAGAREAILLPEELDSATAADLLADFDGLMLLGGPDVDPDLYGEDPHERTAGVDRVRDEFEIALTRAAIEADIPVLGICRGAQVVNVALGGTLHQHISEDPELVAHGVPGVPGGAALHDVDAARGSRLAEALGVERSTVSSHHHQAIATVGEHLAVTGRAPDGVVEALELDGEPWVLTVQWHPEDTAPNDAAQQGVFDAFVRAARDR